jgi:hypothetical protein
MRFLTEARRLLPGVIVRSAGRQKDSGRAQELGRCTLSYFWGKSL